VEDEDGDDAALELDEPPQGIPVRKRVTPRAAAVPAATPPRVRTRPCFTTMRRTSPRRAPRAIRQANARAAGAN